MPSGTALSDLRQMLRAEAGDALSEVAAPDDVARQSILLSNTQKWLAQRYPWDWLEARATVALVAGTHQYAFPDAALVKERLGGPQAVKFGNLRYQVGFRITEGDYNVFDSDDESVRSDPVRKWDLVNVGGVLKIEVWPRPASTQTLILRGQRPLNALAADVDKCDVDDLLIVLFCAAEILGRAKAGDAQAKLAKAQARLNELKAAMPAANDVFILGGAARRGCDRPRRYMVVSGGGGTVTSEPVLVEVPVPVGIVGSGGPVGGS